MVIPYTGLQTTPIEQVFFYNPRSRTETEGTRHACNASINCGQASAFARRLVSMTDEWLFVRVKREKGNASLPKDSNVQKKWVTMS